MKTNVWLRECVYKRVTPTGKKPGFSSAMWTFGTSAFWVSFQLTACVDNPNSARSQHGIAGGYYIAFFFGGFVQTAGRLCRSNLRPLLLPPQASAKSAPPTAPTLAKRIYDLLGIACAVLIVNYTALPFMLLNIKDSLTAWSALGWYGHVMVFGAMAFFYSGGAALCQKAQKARVKKVAHEANNKASNGTSGIPPVTPGIAVMLPVDFAFKVAEKRM